MLVILFKYFFTNPTTWFELKNFLTLFCRVFAHDKKLCVATNNFLHVYTTEYGNKLRVHDSSE